MNGDDGWLEALENAWGALDFVVHAIAFSDKTELTGRFVNTTRENFRNSLTISCYSFIDVARRAAALYAPMAPFVQSWGEMPVDAIQALFAALDPLLGLKKFSRFAAMDSDSADARAFVALEDWLNDGVPLAASVAADCLEGWYGRNDTARLDWRIAGAPIDPAAISAIRDSLFTAGDLLRSGQLTPDARRHGEKIKTRDLFGLPQ